MECDVFVSYPACPVPFRGISSLGWLVISFIDDHFIHDVTQSEELIKGITRAGPSAAKDSSFVAQAQVAKS